MALTAPWCSSGNERFVNISVLTTQYNIAKDAKNEKATQCVFEKLPETHKNNIIKLHLFKIFVHHYLML